MPQRMAFLFPGQGSQFVGMAHDLYEREALARERFREANEILGFDLANVCFSGPAEELQLTANAQPAILVHSVIACELLRARGITPVAVAGHSLGEYSALVASGSMPFADAVRAGASARPLHAGGGPGGCWGDGRHPRPGQHAGGAGLCGSHRRRGGATGQLQLPRANRHLRARWGSAPGHGPMLGTGRRESHGIAGERALS